MLCHHFFTKHRRRVAISNLSRLEAMIFKVVVRSAVGQILSLWDEYVFAFNRAYVVSRRSRSLSFEWLHRGCLLVQRLLTYASATLLFDLRACLTSLFGISLNPKRLRGIDDSVNICLSLYVCYSAATETASNAGNGETKIRFTESRQLWPGPPRYLFIWPPMHYLPSLWRLSATRDRRSLSLWSATTAAITFLYHWFGRLHVYGVACRFT